MRLQRLEVQGFGSLGELSIDFHPAFTVLVGPNESGKSTVHRAVRAALYGIDGGGQGRPVDRSDWSRWMPWSSAAYGVALTYTLAAGRTVRVARRLESREQTVQVLEIGGSELTEELRRGRHVVPGLYHLGIDEAVFCATAWLGDDGLRPASAEAAPQRSAQLQEAIERLADTRRGVTAAAAVSRLREALAEIGTERRTSSPLGMATARLRELERVVREVSRHLETVGVQRERLRSLDLAATSAQEERDQAERAWLQARVAGLERRRALVLSAAADRDEAQRVLAETTPYISVPLDLETRVSAVAGELTQAEQAATASAQRAAATAHSFAAARARRAELEGALELIGRTPPMDSSLSERAAVAAGEVERLAAAGTDLSAGGGSQARVTALRQEIARTGLGAMPLGSADALAELVRTARRGGALRYAAAALVVLLSAAAGAAVAWQHHATTLGAATIGVGTGLAGLLLATAVVRRRRAATAEAELRSLEDRLGIRASDLRQVRDRIPALQALHAALLQEERAAAGRQAEAEAVSAGARAALVRCQALAAEAGVSPRTEPSVSTAAVLGHCRLLLEAVDDALALQARRQELEAERSRLDAELITYESLQDDQRRAAATVQRLGDRLEQTLRAVGLPATRSATDAAAIAASACAQRRRHQEAERLLASTAQRLAALGDEAVLREASERFRAELESRGEASPDTEAAGEEHLQDLEERARRATQSCHVATTQAAELRARLEGAVESLPSLADLEDERASVAAERDRLVRRQLALTRAISLIEAAARRTHRDLAPRLAEWVATHLDALTDSRYHAVNVDTDHFAVSLLCRDRPDMVPLECVSHGTRDQVSLLLRLALCETLSGGSEPVPVLLDEPLLTADPGRRATLIQFLHNMASTHQIVLSTADPAIADAVRDCCGDLCAVVALDAARASSQTGKRVRIAG